MDTALHSIQRLDGRTCLPWIVSWKVRATPRKMAGNFFDCLGFHSGSRAGQLQDACRFSRRSVRARNCLGMADAKEREPVGIGLVSRGRGFVDYFAHLQQSRRGVMTAVVILARIEQYWR